jgi:hypothetical protein
MITRQHLDHRTVDVSHKLERMSVKYLTFITNAYIQVYKMPCLALERGENDEFNYCGSSIHMVLLKRSGYVAHSW